MSAGEISRRTMLGALGVGAAASLAGARTATAAVPRPAIHPRSDWAKGIPDVRGLPVEEDVRFLLVHHSETPNSDAPQAIPGRIRSMWQFHTTEKGWPDVAYNFFVDAHGGIWEGRTGSLTRAVRGDATGGSQGHAILCCFIGDHVKVAPTPAAQRSMASLLAWLADRHHIDLAAGRTITFTSRGSNKWPAGSRVTTTPIAGHRDMSETSCPGDAAYPLVVGPITRAAAALAHAGPRPAATATTSPSPTRTPSASSTTGASTTSTAAATATVATTPSSSPSAGPSTAAAAPTSRQGDSTGWGWLVAAGAAVVGGAGLVGRHFLRTRQS